jgi:hypothetical protein
MDQPGESGYCRQRWAQPRSVTESPATKLTRSYAFKPITSVPASPSLCPEPSSRAINRAFSTTSTYALSCCAVALFRTSAQSSSPHTRCLSLQRRSDYSAIFRLPLIPHALPQPSLALDEITALGISRCSVARACEDYVGMTLTVPPIYRSTGSHTYSRQR